MEKNRLNSIIKEAVEINKALSTMEINYIKKTLERAEYLENYFESNSIPYETFDFFVDVPEWKKFYLFADGEEIKVLPNGLKSGKIEKNIKDSVDLENQYYYANINFNSLLETNVDISTPIFYNVPALAVSKESIIRIINSNDVDGYLSVVKRRVKNKNFIVGDLEKAKLYIIIHYDALWKGAIDNTSSLSLFLSFLKHKVLDLERIAIFFIGFTEITYDWPEYWDYSFKQTKNRFEEYFERISKILIVDCIGYKNTQFLNDKEYLEAYETFGDEEKLIIFGTPLEDLYSIYHATNDSSDKYSERQLEKDIISLIDVLK